MCNVGDFDEDLKGSFRTAYGKKKKSGFKTSGVSRVKQSFKDEADINRIMKKYVKTGVCDYVNRFEPFYGDVFDVVDYRTCLDKVRMADDMFFNLPIEVRKKFSDDPAKFVDFIKNPENRQDLVKMGLIQDDKKNVEVDASNLEENEKKNTEKA